MLRLDKHLCDSGAGTRSQVKLLLKAGRVTVDGRVCKDGGSRINPDTQQVALDGAVLGGRRRTVVMMNKPAGYVTATRDDDQATVMDLLPPQMKHLELKPIGRLDKATEGLLLLTNDGELLHRVISPKKEVPKVYYARLDAPLGPEDQAAFARGIVLEDGLACLPAGLEILGDGREVLVTLHEGKFHQIKRMVASRGAAVCYLKRLSMGPLSLDPALERGEYRPLTEEEVIKIGGKV